MTSWRLYGEQSLVANAKVTHLAPADSIYTERYMGLPNDNPDGYINASISHVEGFKNIDFLFAHGSGDDNVHFAHSAHLLDMLTAAQIRNFRFRMFTDRSLGHLFSSYHWWLMSSLIAVTTAFPEEVLTGRCMST